MQHYIHFPLSFLTWHSSVYFSKKKSIYSFFHRGWRISVANIIVECKYMYILNIIDFDFIVIFQLLFGVLEFSTVTHDLQL